MLLWNLTSEQTLIILIRSSLFSLTETFQFIDILFSAFLTLIPFLSFHIFSTYLYTYLSFSFSSQQLVCNSLAILSLSLQVNYPNIGYLSVDYFALSLPQCLPLILQLPFCSINKWRAQQQKMRVIFLLLLVLYLSPSPSLSLPPSLSIIWQTSLAFL